MPGQFCRCLLLYFRVKLNVEEHQRLRCTRPSHRFGPTTLTLMASGARSGSAHVKQGLGLHSATKTRDPDPTPKYLEQGSMIAE